MKSWFIPGLIILGLALILAALFIPSRSLDSIGKKNLAIVLDVSGRAQLQGLDQTDFASIQKKTAIKNLDVITTQAQSNVVIQLIPIKAEIRIVENSTVLIEENTEGIPILTLKSGDLVIEGFGQKDSLFWIKKDGRQLSGMDYSLSHEAPTAKSYTARNKMAAESEKSDTLSQVKIEEILSNKKNDFFRCYGQLIQKEEQAHGQMLLSFEILPTGKVSTVTFTKAELNQPYFLSCLKEVVMRTTFPSFEGENITTVFPLKFE